jgi:hypothetical protein
MTNSPTPDDNHQREFYLRMVRQIQSHDAAQAWTELSASDTYRIISAARAADRIPELMEDDAFGHPLFLPLARAMVESTQDKISYDTWVSKAFEKMREFSHADKSTRDLNYGLGKGELFKDIDKIVLAADSGKISIKTAVCMMVDGLEYNIVMAQL